MPTKISSLTHPLVKHLVKIRKDSSYRNQCKSCLVMGKQLIDELQAVVKPITLLEGAPEAIYKKVTGLKNPEPYIAEFPLPAQTSLETVKSVIVIDQVSDPGNLGTLLRTALALGWGGIFLLPNAVDPFNDKVVRASKGALFYLPYTLGDYAELRKLASGFTPLVADLGGESLENMTPPKKPLLVLSNEARGVSSELKNFGQKVTIPIKTMESLNVAVAGAILMYELCKTKN